MKNIQKGTLKRTINKARKNPKRCSNNTWENKKRHRAMRTRGNREQIFKMADLRSNISIITLYRNDINIPRKKWKLSK